MNIPAHIAVAAAFVVALTGCTGPSKPDAAPTASSSTTTPHASKESANAVAALVPIGDKLVTVQPTWRADDDPTAFLVNVLHYTQTLAIQGGVPVPAGGLKYHVVTANQVLECDKSRTPSTVNGTSQNYYAIMWCPEFNGLVVLPQVIANTQLNLPELLMLAGAFYGNGVASFVRAGDPDLESSCYHGLIIRRAINTNQVKWDVGIRAFNGFYDGGASTTDGLLNGICTNLK